VVAAGLGLLRKAGFRPPEAVAGNSGV
jgi:hypothetical protein